MPKQLLCRNLLITISCIFVLSAFVIKLPGNKEIFKSLYALEGRWMMKTSKGYIGEEWVKIESQYLQNRGFIVKGRHDND
jgi:hypothetical protein